VTELGFLTNFTRIVIVWRVLRFYSAAKVLCNPGFCMLPIQYVPFKGSCFS